MTDRSARKPSSGPGMKATGSAVKKASSGSQRRQQKPISIGFEDGELRQLDARAQASGMSRSAYVRTVVLQRPALRAVRRPVVEKAELGRALGELGRVGNNLNQLTKLANQGRFPRPSQLDRTLTEVRAVALAIMRALGYEADA